MKKASKLVPAENSLNEQALAWTTGASADSPEGQEDTVAGIFKLKQHVDNPAQTPM
jgi:hypothetical protein